MRLDRRWMAFNAYRNRHFRGEAIVCGLGPSIEEFEAPEGVPIIGVNDIGKHLDPHYLVVIDRPSTFGDRIETIKQTKCRQEFVSSSTAKLWRKHLPESIEFMERPVRQHLAWPDWYDHANPQLHQIGGSPLTGVSLAGFMGVHRIGVIGADYNDMGRFEKNLAGIKYAWKTFAGWLFIRGIELVNLSPQSVLDLPLEEVASFG